MQNATTTKIGKYSNPVKSLTVSDYPLGGNKRGEMRFWIESNPKKGERACRQSTGKPKYSTYVSACVIVTGEDNRTYFISLVGLDMIKVPSHDFMDVSREAGLNPSGGTLFANPNDPEVMAVFSDALNFIRSAR